MCPTFDTLLGDLNGPILIPSAEDVETANKSINCSAFGTIPVRPQGQEVEEWEEIT